MTAIVTNAKNRIAYNIAKSLGLKGITVYTSDFIPNAMSFSSKFSKGNFVYPSPYNEQKEFLESIISNIQKYDCKVLIPVSEETYLIAKHREEIQKHTNLVVPDFEQILFAHNKDKWVSLAEGIGIPCPKSYEISELITNSNNMDISYPVLIKPKQGGGGWGIVQINSSDELQRILDEQSHCGRPLERFFIQEKIEGETHCVAMLFRHGNFKAKVGYRQMRSFPVDGGQATLRMSYENKEAENYFERFLEKLNWHGICQADFIIETASGTPYLIDINPRFWGSLAQGIAAGVDFPYKVYRMALDGDIEPQYTYDKGIVTRWVGGDLRAFFPMLRKTEHKRRFIREFMFPSPVPQYYDDISFSDPFPFFYWLTDAAWRVLRKRYTGSVSHGSLNGIWE
jgi:predicted ATP-grasp superfamily ATP-dependent carboligase